MWFDCLERYLSGRKNELTLNIKFVNYLVLKFRLHPLIFLGLYMGEGDNLLSLSLSHSKNYLLFM